MRRIKRKPQFTLPTKYILLGMTVLCVTVMFLSFTFNLSGGPLNAVAGYVLSRCRKESTQSAAGCLKKRII